MTTRPRFRPTGPIGKKFVTTQREVTTHKFEAVHFVMLLELQVLFYVPLIHPLGDHAKSMFAYRCTEEWENVRMSKVFPRNSLFTEPLRHDVTKSIAAHQ